MPRTCNIDKIRAELAWVSETPDANKCGCRNLRCCEETGPGQELALVLLPPSSGRSDGNTTVRLAVNIDGAELSLAGR
jgi:hypothetical protein